MRAPLPVRLRRRLASLTSRLVLTAVALVLLVSLVIGAVATLAVRSYLTGQLDDDVRGAARRAQAQRLFIDSDGSITTDPPGFPGGDSAAGRGFDDPRGQEVGTLTAYFVEAIPSEKVDAQEQGYVLADADDGGTDRSTLTDAALAALQDVPTDGSVHEVDVPGRGTFHVVATAVDAVTESGEPAPYVVIAGLPTSDVDAVVTTLLTWEALLVLGGAAVAALGGLVLVRRQLRPLNQVAATAHRVAALPLDSGEIELAERVPAALTDEHTEVGQVGAALNTLLEHVETSLSARHRSEQQVRQFVADASHELRTPLTTVAGYTELARRRPDDPEAQRTALAKVAEESKRMTALVEDLLLLARLDSGRPLEDRPVDLTRMLVEAVSDARVVAPDHHWRLALPDEAVELSGDEQRLHQVVTNLLTNARKYTPAGSTVTVTALPDGFRVHDDGPGFAPDLVDSAFERFTRGDQARTRSNGAEQSGAGLGLSLVEAIVSAHGGRVSLHSQPGDTAIEVRLPADPSRVSR